MDQSPFSQAETFINATAARFELSRQILELINQMTSQESSDEERVEAELELIELTNLLEEIAGISA
ncbi:MAG: hypothetical protein CMK59_09440 [Proteobacteria bacterium]|nr:hypothetical protein [Pseudomonadota bacterium]